MTHIDIFIEEDNYYPYYQQWVKFHIMPNHRIEEIEVFKTQAIIHCLYKNGSIDKGRHLSPVYRTITSVTKNHPDVTAGYSIISFK